jgi:hypothetical protein
MKTIEMNCTRCGGAGWYEDGKRTFNRVSRWIKVKHNYTPGKNNRLWDYVQDENGYKHYQEQFNPENGLYLDYFTFHGRNYAIEQFLALGNPFYTAVSYSYEDKDGKLFYLSGVDVENIYNPLYIEMDDCGEYVRLYVED